MEPDLQVTRPSWPWLAVVVPLLLLSVVRLERTADGLLWGLYATPVTAALVAILWLPGLLRLLAARGGSVSAAGLSIGLEPLRRLGAARSDAEEEAGRDSAGHVCPGQASSRWASSEKSSSGSAGPLERPANRGGAADVTAPAAPALAPPSARRAIGRTLAELETSFSALLTRLPPGFARTAALESVLAEARVLAPEASGELAERVSTMVDDSEARRAITLALLQGAPAPLPEQTGLALADSLARDRPSFEEYHLLRTIRDRYADLSTAGRSRVVTAVAALLDAGRFPSGGDRRSLAREIALLSVGAGQRVD